jgi:hypothetical protein
MFLRELFEAPKKVAVAAFGRMNPPTIGHEKLVDKVKSFEGDHYIFLSQTQKPKDNPLPFDVKLEFAKKFFPGVNVGHPSVRTPIQMLQMLEKLGYTDVIYVAGSDRVASFEKLFNDYNGKEYNFNSITVENAGERDPDADGAEGMSASKMRAAAAAGDFEAFAQGVPTPALAQKMYDAVRTGMGVKDKEPVEESEQLNEWVWLIPALATAARIGASTVAKLGSKEVAKQAAKTVAKNSAKAATATGKAIIKNPGKSALAVGGYEVYDTVSDAMEWLEELDVAEDLIKPLAMVMVQYAIPVAAILAVLYGGAKLYDYFNDEENDLKTAEAQGDNPAKVKARLDYLKKHPKYTTHGAEKYYADKEAERAKKRKSKYDTQMSLNLEDVSPEDEDKFHNELDDLVHKYFGDSPDEEKMKKKMRKVKEGSPIDDLKKIITSKVYKKEYLLALKMMKQEAISAADAARRFMHVDARTLDAMADKMDI